MTDFFQRVSVLSIDVMDASYRPDKEQLQRVARELSEIADELQGYVLEPRDGEFPTPSQALALGRFLSTVMRDDQIERGYAHAHVSRGGAGLSNDYLLVRLGDDYTGGIDRDGRVST